MVFIVFAVLGFAGARILTSSTFWGFAVAVLLTAVAWRFHHQILMAIAVAIFLAGVLAVLFALYRHWALDREERQYQAGRAAGR